TLRSSVWYDRLGESYLADAFRAAHEADPRARLYVNDYNVEGINAKSTGLYELVKRLKQQGVPIHGVGLQAHLIRGQVPGDIADNIRRFTELGLDVEITELDVRIPMPATAEKLSGQADDYGAVVSACVSVKGCTGITTWGAFDGDSWVPGTFPGYGAALLFDEQWTAKPAYSAVVRALGGTPEVPSAPPAPQMRTVLSTGFEDGLDGWGARAGESVEQTLDAARTGTAALLARDRTANWQGPAVPVTDLFAPGRLYHVSAWVRLAEGTGTARVSVQRTLPEDTFYEGVSSNTAVTADRWTEVSGGYLPFAGFTALSLYVETSDTLADLLVDDVAVTTEADPGPSPSPSSTPSPSTSPSPSASPSPSTSPSPSPSTSPSPSATPTPAGSCRVSTAVNGWNTGLTAAVTVTNTGAKTIEGWELAFELPEDQRITSVWNAVLSARSGSVLARNASYNASLPPNASVSLGWLADHSTAPKAPTAFTLNGATCTTATP
ncbi:MAG: endo,4-beta-xylanase, partial [Actinomycetota bacterium]|nr:endo,4-beta-xylanase [Actinomycetota bacterium]